MAAQTFELKKKPILWALRRNRRRIPGILLMTVAQAGEALFSVFFALGMRTVIDSAVAKDPTSFTQACLQQGAIIAAVLLSMTVFRHLRDRLTADLERDWKQQLLHGLLHGNYAAVSAYHSGELLNRMNNDVKRLNDGLLHILPNTAAVVTKVVAAVVVLGTLDWRFMLVILCMGALVVLSTGFLRKKMKQINGTVSAHDGRVSGFLQEIMEKLLMVQAMDAADEVERRADVLLQDRYVLHRKRKNLSLLANTGISVLSLGAGFLALVWCAGRVLAGDMSFGSLTAVITLVNQLRTPFVNLSGLLPQYASMAASAERLMELDGVLGTPVHARTDTQQMYGTMEQLGAEDLCFAYDQEQIFRDVSFLLPKGSFCVVTGQSGIGKSTLLKLMLAVYRPDSGQMYIDCSGEKVTLDRSTRGLFAYVPQGNLLLSGTIRENITIAKPDATEEELRHAVYVSAMDAYVPQLPQGLDTPLGEGGAGLSEGQIQRLAIARAVLGGAPILLLDECTSALDEETEKTVLQRLRALPGRTCLAVTHRPAALDVCDHIIRVKDGAVTVSERL